MGLRRPNKQKNPPVFSHEFVIQNHADIVSCVAMVFVVGLMFQATNPVASLFVTMGHNITQNETEGATQPEDILYTNGLKDLFSIFFYMLICVVVHAVIQEYILDKVNRKMHLSKVKHSKFNESGQLVAFYLTSAVWGANIILQENYLPNISTLWEGYPHSTMVFMIKFYFIIQLSYWTHCVPELYFQKVKKEEMSGRLQYTLLSFVFIAGAYSLNFTRVALCLLVLHYTVELLFHLSRLLYFADKPDLANTGFMIWNILFVLVRLVSTTIAVLTFWFGLEQSSQSSINFTEGNFNTQIVRINCLAALCLVQAWMMWNFLTFQFRRRRERSSPPRKQVFAAQKTKVKDTKKKGKYEEGSGDEAQESTENGSVRQRTPKAKRN
ncbi:unnamed protein product [Owenia fusiformis]|uniref:Translocating chain-associated membrane protein n=1 Tax=Owenia fusiformis TaxID=6347 RepID=A0A8S4N2V9_OWEFU|nr:unnamed protein product [Owenia fusiformis]